MVTTSGDDLPAGFFGGVSTSGRGSKDERCGGVAAGVGVGVGVDSGIALGWLAGSVGVLSGVASVDGCGGGSVCTAGDGVSTGVSAGEGPGCAAALATGDEAMPRIC